MRGGSEAIVEIRGRQERVPLQAAAVVVEQRKNCGTGRRDDLRDGAVGHGITMHQGPSTKLQTNRKRQGTNDSTKPGFGHATFRVSNLFDAWCWGCGASYGVCQLMITVQAAPVALTAAACWPRWQIARAPGRHIRSGRSAAAG